ncbi:MAG: FapA family protein, partial [Melioribacteraceae bacterium]|nr:FapA family protein [Melioribacteraceae bacterium]
MLDKSYQSAVAESETNLVEFLVDPLDEKVSEHVLSMMTGNKLYLSRVDDIDLKSYLVNKSRPLFKFKHEDENPDSEADESIGINYFQIADDFRADNSNIEQSGKNYIATIDGLFLIDNKRPRIVQVSLEGSCDVRISDDKMEVIVDIYPSIGDNEINTADEIVNKILDLGVLTDINVDLLSGKLKEVEQNKIKSLNVIVSRGKSPINGIDGRLENCTKVKEKFENFNFDEFHRVNPVISVKEGDLIAILHPPTEGEPGSDVFNQVVNQKPGRAEWVKLGSKVKYSDDDETHIVAKSDGFVDLYENSITVTDTFTVHGDIDFKSGNIVSKGSLKVLGNVKNEFTLSLTKDIEIGGYVGDAYVESGQNIKIRGGFLGKGKGILKSEGNIDLKFVENQTVYCRGS